MEMGEDMTSGVVDFLRWIINELSKLYLLITHLLVHQLSVNNSTYQYILEEA